MTVTLIVSMALVGCFSGFMAGLLGLGGGLIMVPFLTYFLRNENLNPNLPVKMAIATSMAIIVFTSISSVRAHHKLGKVQWRIVFSFIPGIVLGSALASSWVFPALKGATLSILFGLFVGFLATRMFIDKKPKPTRQLPNTPGMLGAGSIIGFLSGLVGAGGAFVSVPFMTWCNVPMHLAVATSAAMGLPIALSNVVGYIYSGWDVADLPAYTLGYIWLPALISMASCSVITAPMGARMAHRLPVVKLKRIFALMMYFLAGYMLYTGINS